MKYSLVCFLMVVGILTGCASTKTVYVPVSSCPEPPAFSMPSLAVDRLPDPPPTEEGLKALAEDYIVMKSELQRAILLLDAYRKKGN